MRRSFLTWHEGAGADPPCAVSGESVSSREALATARNASSVSYQVRYGGFERAAHHGQGKGLLPE